MASAILVFQILKRKSFDHRRNEVIARTALFVILTGAMFLLGVSAHAQGYYVPAPPPQPPLIEEEPPPVVVAPPRRCHVVRETKHDDILDTNDWVEHEVCD